MTHITSRFWQCFSQLSNDIQHLARKNFTFLQSDNFHPSLQLKKIKQVWSVRVGLNHRAIAIEEDSKLYWFWIGSHDEYERLLKQF